ncbi:MAG: hypothetical protein OEW75_09760 [Cyclobacteriaceae bacterium]|nr:hypothetical protein [Cyclobacteriaceae bacterium]
MAGFGIMADAIKTLKRNNSMLHGNKYFNPDNISGIKSTGKIHIKKASQEELDIVTQKLSLQKKKEWKKTVLAILITIPIAFFVLWVLIGYFKGVFHKL